MPDTLTIRPATPYDAQAIARIRVQGWRFAYQGLISQDYLDSLSVAKDTAPQDSTARRETIAL